MMSAERIAYARIKTCLLSFFFFFLFLPYSEAFSLISREVVAPQRRACHAVQLARMLCIAAAAAMLSACGSIIRLIFLGHAGALLSVPPRALSPFPCGALARREWPIRCGAPQEKHRSKRREHTQRLYNKERRLRKTQRTLHSITRCVYIRGEASRKWRFFAHARGLYIVPPSPGMNARLICSCVCIARKYNRDRACKRGITKMRKVATKHRASCFEHGRPIRRKFAIHRLARAPQ